MTLLPINGLFGDGFQVANECRDLIGRCLLGHTMAKIENKRPIPIGLHNPLRLGQQGALVAEQRHRVEISLQAQRRLLPEVLPPPSLPARSYPG